MVGLIHLDTNLLFHNAKIHAFLQKCVDYDSKSTFIRTI